MTSESQKRANAKWDKENMTVLACKVRKEVADKFKAACAAEDTTSNAVLQQAVRDYIDAHPVPEEPEASPGDAETEVRRAALLEQIKNL
jgi:hypothetical protein|nr:MAG TPA: plasmid partition protein ParG-helix-helix, dimer, DNA binding, CELL [Bacteriophage sp.]